MADHKATLPEVIKTIHPLPYYTDRLKSGIMNQLPADTQDNAVNRGTSISNICQDAIAAFDRAMTSDDVLAAAQVADYIEAVRNAIEPQMDSIIKLCDSPLGFRTDRSPAILETNRKRGKGAGAPYSREVVKDCAVEALLRGVRLVGDQFNILAGRCYITMNGYKHLVNSTNISGLQFKITKISVTDSEHIADAEAQWQQGGNDCTVSKRFFCKAYGAITTWEQTEGKATRKLFKAIYEKATGRAFQDADESDEMREGSIDVDATVNEEAPKPAPANLKVKDPGKELAELIKRNEVDERDFVKFVCASPNVKANVETAEALAVAEPALASGIVRSWAPSLKRYKDAVEATA